MVGSGLRVPLWSAGVHYEGTVTPSPPQARRSLGQSVPESLSVGRFLAPGERGQTWVPIPAVTTHSLFGLRG